MSLKNVFLTNISWNLFLNKDVKIAGKNCKIRKTFWCTVKVQWLTTSICWLSKGQWMYRGKWDTGKTCTFGSRNICSVAKCVIKKCTYLVFVDQTGIKIRIQSGELVFIQAVEIAYREMGNCLYNYRWYLPSCDWARFWIFSVVIGGTVNSCGKNQYDVKIINYYLLWCAK